MQSDEMVCFLAQTVYTLAGACKTLADETVPPDAALSAAMVALRASILAHFPFVS